jgi:hypothetical protein
VERAVQLSIELVEPFSCQKELLRLTFDFREHGFSTKNGSKVIVRDAIRDPATTGFS